MRRTTKGRGLFHTGEQEPAVTSQGLCRAQELRGVDDFPAFPMVGYVFFSMEGTVNSFDFFPILRHTCGMHMETLSFFVWMM